MKKITTTLAICLVTAVVASAQVIPSFQFGIKAGANLTSISKTGTFNADNQAGYLGGIYARFGALGLHVQPEAYLTSKNVNLNDNGVTTKAKFTSIDVPILVGTKIGAFGFGARFYTGPVVSFAINKDQTYSSAASSITKLDYKDQNYAWQLGAGVDIRNFSVDLRYEAGLSKQTYGANSTKINLFNLTLGYKIF